MTIKALLASTCLATALATGAPAFAQNAASIDEIDAIYYVTWLEATVREAPTSTSAALMSVYMGDRIPVTGWVNGSDWVRVTFDDGTTGYMWSGVLSPAVVAGADFADEDITIDDSGMDGPAADGAGNSIYDAYQLGDASFLDTTLEDFVGNSDLDDYYAFDVGDWTYVDLALEGLSADADLLLVDEYESVVGSSEIAGTDSEYVQQIVPPGRYYIHVISYEGDTDYMLYVYTEPTDPPPPDTVGNTLEEATAIDAPGATAQTINERLDISDYDDWYAFTLSDFMEVSVSLYGLQSDLDLALVDTNGNPLVTSDNGGNTDEYASTILGPGTHYVHVYVYAGQSDYTLEISATPSAPPPPDGAGNSLDAALDLGALDTATEGASLSGGDWVGPGDPDDYFAFSVDAAVSVELQLTDIVADLDLELLDGNGEIVAVSNNSGSAIETVTAAVQPGTYYAHIYAFDGNSDFALSIRTVPAAQP